MQSFPLSSHSRLLLFPATINPPSLSLFPVKAISPPNLFFFHTETLIYPSSKLIFTSKSTSKDSSGFHLPPIDNNDDDDDTYGDSGTSISSFDRTEIQSVSDEDVDIEIEKIGKNSRRIRSRVAIDASLETIWNLLTDYERLADFIPGLAVSQLLEKRENFARIFQIGQQNLAFGMKFDAKGVVDCYEKDLESLPFGRRRDIEFKMVEGDFQTFEGKWSIEETYSERSIGSETWAEEECQTTLSYVVDVKPKLWLPVGLVEGRLCREIKLNLVCIRDEAMKAVENSTLPTC
ncbi:hypothetical protein BVC80_1543g22 [Macleaya cordata]|uniref:Coenzyme Q-binding protein COQ10 START domain-containing protein n=1 Tax=Macleaya cordata TaxID=56857 RepID=A0A200R1J4_MACCD|nr:hypothetical protein BVC80_1543g22 [Macleaya cordata]